MFVKDLPMISNWVPHKSMTWDGTT
jgi:hypothetical protein